MGECTCDKYGVEYLKDGDGFCAVEGYAYGGGGEIPLRTGPEFGCIHHKTSKNDAKLVQR